MKVSGLSLDFGSFQDKQRGVVRAIGRANDFYYDEDAVDADVDVGDHVVFRHSFWTELENEIFATLEGELGFVQRCWIDGKL